MRGRQRFGRRRRVAFMRIRNCLVDPAARPLVMGVLNVTPDSFSDGGQFADADAAVRRACEMVEEGADIIDVGPESTRPGSAPIPAEVQIRRSVPVVRGLRERDDRIAISIDTHVAAVADAALAAGADMINDTSALRDDEAMAEAAARTGVPVVLMHRRGTPRDMQAGGGPQYEDVIGEICGFFRERTEFAERRGIDRERILLDPGVGFGKRVEHNLLILRELHRFTELGPVVVGASRKRFLGSILGIEDPVQRGAGSLACAAIATLAGAAVIRAHDVRATVECVRTCVAVRSARA